MSKDPLLSQREGNLFTFSKGVTGLVFKVLVKVLGMTNLLSDCHFL